VIDERGVVLESELKGELAGLCAAVSWAISIAIFAKLSSSLRPIVINFLKCGIGVFCFVVLLIVDRSPWPTSGYVYGILMLSGVAGLAVGDSFFFLALPKLGAQVSAVFQCLAPPMAALLAVVFLNETLSGMEWLGLIVTVSSVAILLTDGTKTSVGTEFFDRSWLLALLFAFLSSLLQAVGAVLARSVMSSVDPAQATVIRLFPAFLMLGVWLKIHGSGRMSVRETLGSWRDIMFRPLFFWVFFGSFVGTFLGLLLQSTGIKYGKVGVVISLASTSPIWLLPFSAFYLKERISLTAIICTLSAVTGTALMVYF